MERYLTHDGLVSKLTAQEIELYLRKGVSVRPNDVLQKVVTRLVPEVKIIVEIGTWMGVSTSMLASCSNVEHVYTFDINPFPQDLPKKLGLDHKITYSCLPSSEAIYEVIKNLKPDFTYIDGSHKIPDETKDFMFMKEHCDRIIMDDTDDKDVFGIFEPFGAQRVSFRFAVWMKNGDYSIVDEIKKDLIWDEPKGKMNFEHLEGK